MFFWLSLVAALLPPIAYGVFYLLAFQSFYLSRGDEEKRSRHLVSLWGAALSFRAVYALYLTGVQYWLWSKGQLTSLLIDPTWSNGTYFLGYAFERFWLNLLLSLLFGLVFLLFLRVLAHYRDRFFEEGEVELGGFFAFLNEWPNGVAFLALSLFLVLAIATFRLIRQKGGLTRLQSPFFLATLVVLVYTEILAPMLSLPMLII